jgi:hypothetical protein
VLAQIYYNDTAKSLSQLVHQASTEKCTAASASCFEWLILSIAHVAPDHGNADLLQHTAMLVRIKIRGTVMLFLQQNVDVYISSFCEENLNKTKASPFGVRVAYILMIQI